MCFNVLRMLGLVGEKVVTWLDREGGLQKYHTNFSQVTKLQGYKFKPSYQVTKLQPYKIIKTIKKLLIKNGGDVMTLDERLVDELDMERELYRVLHECWVVV